MRYSILFHKPFNSHSQDWWQFCAVLNGKYYRAKQDSKGKCSYWHNMRWIPIAKKMCRNVYKSEYKVISL